MGFADRGFTRVMGFVGSESAPTTDEVCDPLTADDFDEVVRFDSPRFGASRRELLAKVIDQHPGRALVLRRRGKVAGYVVAHDRTLGPLVTDTSESLTALVSGAMALEWVSPPRINVPPESGHIATLQRLGFEERRQLRHMRRGTDALPGRRESIAAQVSLGEG
jgi:hypothetical protein